MNRNGETSCDRLSIAAILWSCIVVLIGCGDPATNSPASEEMDLERWRTLDLSTRIDADVLKRLKNSISEFKDEQKWSRFLIEELGPLMENFQENSNRRK